MFLKKFLQITILSITVTTSYAAVFHSPFHEVKIFEKDHIILNNKLKENTDDLSALRAFITLSFMLEKFDDVIVSAPLFLKKVKDKKIAEIYILSLINLNSHKNALKEMDTLIGYYDLSKKEKGRLLYQRKLMENRVKTNPFPESNGLHKIGDRLILLSYLPRENIFLINNRSNNVTRLDRFEKNKFYPIEKIPEYLEDINLNNLVYVSSSANGKDVLLSMITGNDEIIIQNRKYDTKKKKWSPPLKISNLNPGSYNNYANFAYNSKSAIFVSNADPDNGMEIYISSKNQNDEWEIPKKLPGINSPLDETSLFVHPDGENIYFSSNGRPGKGGFDIYSGSLKDNKGPNVENIINLADINTYRNELYPFIISLDANSGFLNFQVADSQILFKANDFKPKPKPVSFLDSYIYDRDTGLPVGNANIQIVKEIEKSVKGDIIKIENCDTEGFCGLSLIRNSSYLITIFAEGYNQLSTIIDIGTDKDILINKFFITKVSEEKRAEKKVPIDDWRILFLQLKPQNCPSALGNKINFELQNSLKELFKKALITENEIQPVMTKLPDFKNCYNKECAEKISLELQAKLTIFGTITGIEKKSVVPLGEKDEKQYILKIEKKTIYRIQITTINYITDKIKTSEFILDENEIKQTVKKIIENIK